MRLPRSVIAMAQRARLVFAPEVRAVVTPQVIEQARASVDLYICVRCDKEVNAFDELTSVVLVKPGNFPHVMQFAHFDCMPSQIIAVPDFDPARLEGQGEDVTYLKVAYEPGRDGHPYEAMLLVDRPRGVDVVTETGDRAGIHMQELLGAGMELAMAMSQPFPALPDYTIHLNPDGRGHFTHTGGHPGLFLEEFDFADDRSGAWIATARATGWITVLSGNLGIEHVPVAETQDALADAIRSGTVAGGRIRAITH